jgi:hypothetical protein
VTLLRIPANSAIESGEKLHRCRCNVTTLIGAQRHGGRLGVPESQAGCQDNPKSFEYKLEVIRAERPHEGSVGIWTRNGAARHGVALTV